MVRKFVFVPGEGRRTSRGSVEPVRKPSKLVQWLLLGLALTVSAIGFSMAKSTAAHAAHASAP